MSPGWSNDRLEQFGGIGSMIGHWEEMERREEEGIESSYMDGGKKRSSKKSNELIEIFEEGVGGQRYDCNSKLERRDRVDTISSTSSLIMDAAKPEQLDVTKNVYSDKTTESRDCDWLRNSANRKPGDSVRGVKRKVVDSEIIGGIKKQRKWRGSKSKD